MEENAVTQQPENQGELTPKWVTAKLILGIISMVIFAIVALQSCAVGVGNTFSNNGESSGSFGFLIALNLLITGIIAVVARKSVKKAPWVISAVLLCLNYLYAKLFSGSFSDLLIWGFICFALAAFYLLSTVRTKKGYIIVGIILAVALAIIMAPGSASKSSVVPDTRKSPSSETSETTNTQNSPMQTDDPQTNTQSVAHVGDTIHDRDLDIVYVASGDYIESNEYLQPGDGKKYIFIKLAFINTSEKNDRSVSSYSFEAYADGYSCDAYYGGDENLSATLSAGRSSMGSIYFEVPADAKEIEIEYETSWITGEKITFSFDGNKDSGYVIEKNVTATDDALKVGETATSKSLNITYLDCFADSSDNMFITPKQGYHYVTCELEFENVSSSDETVTMYSFDCYADGIVCEQAFFRDEKLAEQLPLKYRIMRP